MGRPSNPRLMARVLEAVKHLGEVRGSSARQVLELMRQGNKPPTRNLTMQVQRALKNAVTAGLLKLRSGRYKMLIPLKNSAKKEAPTPSGKANAKKRSVGNSSGSKKKVEDVVENLTDSRSSETLEAGRPRSRCSHCKKHKRKSSRRRRRRSSSRRRKRPTKQASERKSRKLRRRGEEDVSNRRERSKKISAPGSRGKSEVPDRKTNPETNEDNDNRENGGRRDRSESSTDTDAGDDGPARMTKAKLRDAGRKNDSSSHRSASKPRRSSRKRNSSVNKMLDNNSEETARMECCDGGQELAEEDANASQENGGSSTSI